MVRSDRLMRPLQSPEGARGDAPGLDQSASDGESDDKTSKSGAITFGAATITLGSHDNERPADSPSDLPRDAELAFEAGCGGLEQPGGGMGIGQAGGQPRRRVWPGHDPKGGCGCCRTCAATSCNRLPRVIGQAVTAAA